MGDFLMPSLGADMEEGTLLRWLVAVGDHVERGQTVAEVDTDKAVLEIEVFESGVIHSLLVGEGEKVPVGTVLATIRTDGAPAQPSPPAQPAREPEHVHSPLVRHEAEELHVDVSRIKGTGPDGTVTRRDVEHAAAAAAPRGTAKATPAARTLAASLGVDLETMTGTGPDGAIVRADVERAAGGKVPAPPPARAPQPVESSPPADRRQAMRRSIAALMARSKREIPHYYLSTDIDMAPALDWLEETNANRPVAERVLPAALLMRATALAVADVPEMNGFYTDDAFHPSAAVHLGVAVSLRDTGLVAPAIHDAETKSVTQLMSELRDLVKRARAGVLRASEMSDPTITVTNLGDQGVGAVFGVIYPPQVALVGFGKIVERPWASSGMVGAHRTVTATLAADHRVSDGHRGALYLAAIDKLLQHPEAL